MPTKPDRSNQLPYKLARQIRSNVLGLVAIFIALTGTAFALPGNNTVDSGDIINGQVRSPDVRANDLTADDLAFGAVTYSELAPSAFAAGDIARPGSPFATGYGVAPDAIQSAEVSANTLTGADINEASLDLDVERVLGSSPNNSERSKTAVARCPAGKLVIGTGGDIIGGRADSDPTGDTVGVTIYAIDPGATNVEVTAYEASGGSSENWIVRAWAICARLAG